ncbi:hypothetical protein Snoj_39120 [Streptomyces nojiriensis]|uniref:Uncharacterized protein n=2 Tax=Streptomyces nojiriensis TaxID=66374 RepID=A0ABQ3SPE3_9ACTN|nr:hypothetical protein [Streptomyces nojiriensis]QTI43540.1 hypothetical protein JYK04_01302 [Streptomyces nojiriensis]GHI69994.1 hypothetical protein Snoj_39120 [Streptomyces nojiriensis]
MTRTPDAVTLASLDTHRLIVTLPNQGPADVRSNLPRATAAAMLRRLADELDTEQLLPAPPGEAFATLTQQLTRRHRPAEAARLAADALAHHTRELADMLTAALDRGDPTEAPSAGRHLISLLRSHAATLDSPPRTPNDNVLHLAAARLTRRTQR